MKEEDFPAAKVCWYETDKIRKEFLSLLHKKSNFQKIGGMLDEFATKAHYVQLKDFLTMISEGYETMQKTLEERVDILQKSAEDPAKLKKEIGIKNREIDEVKEKINNGIEAITREYTNDGGLIKLKAEEEFENFKRNLTAANGFDDIEKKTLAGQDIFFDFQEKLRDQLIAACNQKLIEITDKTSLAFATFIPRLSKDDFEKLKTETEKNAYVKKSFTEESWCFLCEKKYERSIYSVEKHIDFFKKQILGDLTNKINTMRSSLVDDANEIGKKYRDELRKNMDKKNFEYNDLMHRLTKSEEMREEMKNIKAGLSSIKSNVENVRVIKGGIEHVIS
jgi:methyl-accepting chemotaxis protein